MEQARQTRRLWTNNQQAEGRVHVCPHVFTWLCPLCRTYVLACLTNRNLLPLPLLHNWCDRYTGHVLSKHCFKQVSRKILLLYNKDSGPLIFLSDLQTVTERLHSGYYSCVRLFRADMKRVFSNCRQFNERGSDYYRCATALEKFFIGRMTDAGLWNEPSP